MGRHFKAIIIDLEEVLAQTVEQHARAWKVAVEEFLEQGYNNDILLEGLSEYIHRNPIKETVKEFLKLKDITLPDGNPGDSPEASTIHGLANKENQVFLDMISREGVKTFSDTVRQVTRWKNRGLKAAVISSGRNADSLIGAAGIRDLFDFVLDASEIDELGLKQKPSPDAFYYVCKMLEAAPEECVLIEDSPEGIQAGCEASFGLVVGVARKGSKRELLALGADVSISNMEELRTIGMKKTYNYEM